MPVKGFWWLIVEINMTEKKGEKVQFRAEPELVRQLQTWADREELTAADFTRKLLRFARDLYRKEGSLHGLKIKFGGEAEKKRA